MNELDENENNMILRTKIIFLLFLCYGTYSFSQNEQNNFDWNNYVTWKNKTTYSKTYIVNQKHPNTSDGNDGSFDNPLKTINRAAQLVQEGERVLIYSGVYRETIYPKNGGAGEDKMISYEAAPGEHVIVKGSKIFKGTWEQKKVYTDIIKDTTLTYTWSRRTWVATMPDSFFDNDYYPFQLPNILPEEHTLMPWAKLVKDLPPYTSTRAMLFENGARMIQLENYGDVVRVPGSFWIDKDGKTIHIHSFDSGNPNKSVIEIGVKEHLLKPQKIGLNYIQIRGLTFEHCSNGFLRTSTGAVTTLGGHHWIIEDNTIRQINSSGLEFGFMAFERKDPNPENIKRGSEHNIGHVIVRNNVIHDCGTAGIRSFVVNDGLIANNHIYKCGWQDAENYWECSGIKMLVTHRTLVKNNHIHDIQGGNGIWLDWDIRYSRVTQNKIHDVQNIQGGIFVEASHFPNLVDNNFIWNIDGNGIYANDTDYLMIYHNLVANITGNVVHAIVQTDRYQNGRKLTAEENLVYNNIFINGLPMRFSSNSNKADNNLYISTKQPNYFDIQEIRKKGLDANSIFGRAEVYFNSDVEMFKLVPDFKIQAVSKLKEVTHDFFNNLKESQNTIPGPFNKLPKHTSILLNEKPSIKNTLLVSKISEKPIQEHTALVSNRYSADPSAHVFEDKIYIYASHDQTEESSYTDPVDKFDMVDYKVMSINESLTQVTDHDIALKLEDIPWAKRQLWAPDAAYANNQYYLYFPAKAAHGEFEIGVAIGNRPEGPFTPLPTSISGSYSIDPAVFKDTDGAHYMYFGGIGGGFLQNHDKDSTQLLPQKLRPAVAPKIAKLKGNMIEFEEAPKDVLILDKDGTPILAGDTDKRFFEAAWVHLYNDKYYLSYSTGDTHNIVYAIGDNPYGPFVYQGVILHPVVGWTTHHSILKFKKDWYLFYHDSKLSGGITHQRNVKMCKLYYDKDGRIQPIYPYGK